MGPDAGFAAAIAIREQVLADVQRILYHAGKIGPRLVGSYAGQTANLFLELPSMSLRAADANRMRIGLTAHGNLTLTLPGGAPESREVRFSAELLVTPTARLSPSTSRLIIGFAATSASLVNYAIQPYAGGPYSAAAQALIASPAFATVVQALLTQQLGVAAMGGNGFDVSFLGRLASDPSTTVTPVVLDGVLVLGLDSNAGGLMTSGNPGLLSDFAGSNDVSAWTNPLAVPQAFRAVRDKIATQVAASGASLDSYSIAVEEGWLRMAGSASKTGGSATFSMQAVPKLFRPGVCDEWDEEYGEHVISCTPDRDELWFDMVNVQVDVDLDWWATLLEVFGGILTLGLGVFVAESIVAMMRGNITAQFEASGNSRAAARVQEFTLAGTTEPIIQLRIEAYECHAAGVFVGLTFRPQYSAAKLVGPSALLAEQALSATLRYSVTLPFDSLPADPNLRVRWTVRRADTGVVVSTIDGPAASLNSLALTGAAIPFLAATRFGVEVRVYQQLGAQAIDLFNDRIFLDIVDRLDRTHPYARWTHEVYTPQVQLEADGSRTVLGGQIRVRVSNLHRTAIPGRCRMASSYSTEPLRGSGPGVTDPKLEYLDALPFPRSELDARRAAVCDYCFYGGPTKTVALIP